MPHMPLWSYFQVCSYVNNSILRGYFLRELTEFETVCFNGDHVQKTTSTSYMWLQNPKMPGTDRFRERWSEELGSPITDSQWERVCILSHKCSLSTRMQETAYKMLTHWYATPEKIHKWYPQTSDTCWRCGKEKGTLLHNWWHCEVLLPFWSKVRNVIYQITETKLKLDAACCLLHISNFSFKKYKNSLSRHLINAANSLIPLFRKSTSIPTVKDWLHKVSYICEMKDTKAQSTDIIERYHKTWSPWFVYRHSRAYEELVGRD